MNQREKQMPYNGGAFYKSICNQHSLFACEACKAENIVVPDWNERKALDALLGGLKVPPEDRCLVAEALCEFVQARVLREQAAKCIEAHDQELDVWNTYEIAEVYPTTTTKGSS